MSGDEQSVVPTRVTLTEQEAADYLRHRTGLRFSKQMVKERRLAGLITGHKIGRVAVYKPADLDAFLAVQTADVRGS